MSCTSAARFVEINIFQPFNLRGDHSNVPAKLEELNKTYGTPNLISQAESMLWEFGSLKLRMDSGNTTYRMNQTSRKSMHCKSLEFRDNEEESGIVMHTF